MIKMSHDAGFAVMVHCNGNERIVNALEAGADSIEHGYFMEAETLELFKEKGAFWTPTVIPVAALAGQPGFNEEVIKRIIDNHIANIHKAARMGINLLSGSDAGSFMVPHVKGSIKELDLISDILITDYSSVFYDYAILKRPIYFYMYDLEQYASDLRGFYFDIHTDLPGKIYKDETALIEDVKNGVYDYSKMKEFNAYFNNLDDGKASERVVDIIAEVR